MVVFIGREKELAMLNQAYLKGGNSIVVLYGREQIGKTTLVKKFVQDKTYVYYQARELSEKEQNRYFEKALFSVKEKAEKERIVFVVHEFDLMQKGYKTFFADFLTKFDEFPKGDGSFREFCHRMGGKRYGFGYGRIGKIYESANQVKRVYFR